MMKPLSFPAIFLVFFLTLPSTFAATQQVFQADGGWEITTDTASQTLNISTKATDGGAVHVNARQAGIGIWVATDNKVGIGTSTPANRLHVVDNTSGVAASIEQTGATGLGLSINIANDGQEALRVFSGAGASRHTFYGNGNATFSIGSGSVGIDDTTPTEGKLVVSGTGYFTNTVTVGTPTADSHAATKSYVDSATVGQTGWTDGGSSVYLTTATDKVGVGTSTPLRPLHVLGTTDVASPHFSPDYWKVRACIRP